MVMQITTITVFSANIDTVPMQHMYASLGFLNSIDNLSQTDLGNKTTLDLATLTVRGLGCPLAELRYAKYREMQELYSDDDHLDHKIRHQRWREAGRTRRWAVSL